jgi:RNA polymerase sigma-70 factor (ECF subfamily)
LGVLDKVQAVTDERSDEELLHAHVGGEEAAFDALVRRHRDRLWAVALRTLGDREEAADALQDALLSAYRSAARFRGESAVTTWMHRIVINSCLDRIRRRQARPTVPLAEAIVATAAPAVDRDTVLDVRAALATLPVEQRAALVLVDIQGYGVAEAAVMLGVAEGTVKSRCARGRARLAIVLGYLRHDQPHGGRERGASHAGNRPPGGGVPSENRSPTGSSPTGSSPTGSSPTGSSPTGSSPTGSTEGKAP